MSRNLTIRLKSIAAIASAVLLPCSSVPQSAQHPTQEGTSSASQARTESEAIALPDGHNWQQYIRAPKTPTARPMRVVTTSGNVQNAGALLAPQAGQVAILTRKAGDSEPTNIVLDYGIEVGGVPSFDVAAAFGTPELKASYSEFLGYVSLNGDRGGTHSADPHRYDIYTIAQPGIVTNKYIQGGERYQMISLTTPGSVSLASVSIQLTHYIASPNEYRGHFVCSDDDLDLIWYASAYTLQTNMLPAGHAGGSADPTLNNDLPVIVDGAKRDRSVWSGDLVVQGPVDYYSTYATEYVRNSLQLLSSNADADGRVSTNLNAEWPVHTGPSSSPHVRVYSSNYTLWWVHALADYYLYTGDKKFLAEQWPALTKELDWASTQINKNGLFETNKDNGLDWDYYDGPKLGEVTAFNALYYRALIDGAEMADAIGERDRATQYRSRAKALREAINKMLYNTTTGLYDVSDQERGTIAQDANIFPILFGVAPQDKVPAILAKLKESLWTTNGPRPFHSDRYKPIISPFLSGFELMARFQTGDDPDGFDLLSILWRKMASSDDDETSTVWENLTLDGKPGLGMNTSLAHGWAAMPAVALSSQVLGIQPAAAGYSTWSIKPHPGSLAWAEGSAPTPAGEIGVRWDHPQSTSQFNLHISAPKGTLGRVALPTFGQSVQVTVNGTIVWDGQTAKAFDAHKDGNYLILDRLPGGTYDISVRAQR